MRTTQEQTVYEVLRRARRAEGVTQSALADELQCKQSAVSMFESGHMNALAWDKVERFAARFSVDLSPWTDHAPVQATASRIHLCYCPSSDCPSNVPYMAGNSPCLKPRLITTYAGGPTYCSLCGEVLESRCPNEDCRADVQEGAFCPFCGVPYVSPLPGGPLTLAKATQRRKSIAELFALTETKALRATSRHIEPKLSQSRRNPVTTGSQL